MIFFSLFFIESMISSVRLVFSMAVMVVVSVVKVVVSASGVGFRW